MRSNSPDFATTMEGGTTSPAPSGAVATSPVQVSRPSLAANRRKLFILPVRRSNDESEVSPRTASESSGATGEPSSPTISSRFKRTTSFFSPRTSSNLSLASSGLRSPHPSDLRESQQHLGLLNALETRLVCSETRNELVAYLLGEHRLDLVLRVRFASAVHELMRATDEPDREFIVRAKKVIEVFFDGKSSFRLDESALPASLLGEMHAASTAHQFETVLTRARERVVSDLLKSELVRSKLEPLVAANGTASS